MADEEADPDVITDAITSIAEGGIASGSENGRSFTNLSIRDLVEADKHLAAKRAATKPHHGLRMTKLVPPGTG